MKLKNILQLTTLILLLLVNLASSAEPINEVAEKQWITTFPVGMKIYDFSVDPKDPNILYTTNFEGIFKSLNGGRMWTPLKYETNNDISYSFIRMSPVDSQTIFACASTTKAMTAVCMGILVDDGKIKWDDAVIKYLPDFQLYDPYVTRELKIRDLFTHNSGVGNTDFLWGVMNVTSDEVLNKMRYVEPSYSLRASFIYQNI